MKTKKLLLKFKKPFIIVKISAFLILDVELAFAPPVYTNVCEKNNITITKSADNNHQLANTNEVYILKVK